MSPRLGGGSSSRRVSLFSLIICSLLPSSIYSIYLCNGGTDYACICDSSPSSSSNQSSISPSIPPCSHFIEPLSLPSVDMRIRHVNLESLRGHGGETYEHYFKKRISQLVSSYCERTANECPGMALHLGTENIILLRTHREPQNITRILFNVAKGQTISKGEKLDPDNILDPSKVKYIMGTQAAPLARLLGGVRVESVRVYSVNGTGEEAIAMHQQQEGEGGDNTKLKMMIAIVGSFFFICYAIGIIKLYKDSQDRKRRRKATETTQIVDREMEVKSVNYGSMVTAQPNGSTIVTVTADDHPQHHSYQHSYAPPPLIGSPIMGTSYTRPSSSLDASTLPRNRLSDRQALLMFGCDPSQLPKEASFDNGLEGPPPPHPPAVPSHQPHPSSHAPPPPSSTTNPSSIPAVVLLSSHSLSRDSPLADPLPLPPSSSIDTDPFPPGHRPKSRRGSRVDDGIETIDLTERLVQDDEAPIQFSEEAVKRSLQKRLTDEAWSSSEGEVDVYYKLSEEEGESARGDEWPNGLKNGPNGEEDPTNVVIFSPPRKNREVIEDESSDEDIDDEPIEKRESIDIRDDDDIHAYEMLREELSPMPPPTTQYSHDSDDIR